MTISKSKENMLRVWGAKERYRSVQLAAAIAACLALIVFALTLMPGIVTSGITIIEDEQVPLAMADLGTIFPSIDSVQIQADTAEADIFLENPATNNYFFIFEIILPDTEETLYLSDMTEPGEHIDRITLTRPLPSGEYVAQLIIRAYDFENYELSSEIKWLLDIQVS